MSGQPSPHDAVFRRIFSDPVNAASQLRAVLPPRLVERLDLDQLTLIPGSFVDPELRWLHTDLLFTVPSNRRQALIYVLLEHQSSSDPLMAYRMLRYTVRIWDRHLKQQHGATSLPAIIPLVVHHNQRPWNTPVSLVDLIDLDSDIIHSLGQLLPRYQFLLDDLARIDTRTLRERPLTPATGLVLWLLTITADNEHLIDDLRPWAADMTRILDRPDGVEDFKAFVTYIQTVGNTPADQLHKWFAELGPQAEETYMTTADMLRAEGRLEGRAEGEAQGAAKVLLKQLTLKFGQLPPATLQRVNTATPEQLETWTARILTANTLDEALH